ncbi:MAG: LacI family DNA-binding transcriptional regulator, partial [Christensenellales bacterium]
IAQLCGVSIATVSRVINNPELTSPKTRNLVMKVIEENNYVPNLLAKNIFSKQSNTIALFVYEMENPFFLYLIKTLNHLAFDNKYTLIICNTENNKERELEYLRYCQSTRVFGLIITEGTSWETCDKAASTMKIVLLDRMVENCSYPSVSSDNYGGIQKAIDYLNNLNHKKIAFVAGDQNEFSSYDRLNSFVSIMKKKGYELPKEYIYYGSYSIETGSQALDQFFLSKDKPTAVICSNDVIARGMIYRAQTLGINVPNDLSIIGFDGVPNQFIYPKLTSIKQDIETISHTLIEEVASKSLHSKRHIVPVNLVIGDTCRKI